MKKYYWEFELPEGEFPKCKKCKIEGFFTDEFGMVNEKVYCVNCIEKFELKDKEKLGADYFDLELKYYISKHYENISRKYVFKKNLINDFEEINRDYIYYTKAAIDELSYLLAVRELQSLKQNITKHWLDSVILKYEQFVDALTKVSISELEDYYLMNKPSINFEN